MKRGTVYNRLYTPELWEQVNSENKELLDDFLIELKALNGREKLADCGKVISMLEY